MKNVNKSALLMTYTTQKLNSKAHQRVILGYFSYLNRGID